MIFFRRKLDIGKLVSDIIKFTDSVHNKSHTVKMCGLLEIFREHGLWKGPQL